MLHDESRPVGAAHETPAKKSEIHSTATTVTLADLDAMAEHLRARFAVQVAVDDAGHRRTYLYRNAGAAERCVKRAADRGRTAHVSLVQMLPVGVVVGLGGGR